MTSITSTAQYRQRVIRYAEKKCVTQVSLCHHVSRQAIYEWKAKYDGSSISEDIRTAWRTLKGLAHFKSNISIGGMGKYLCRFYISGIVMIKKQHDKKPKKAEQSERFFLISSKNY